MASRLARSDVTRVLFAHTHGQLCGLHLHLLFPRHQTVANRHTERICGIQCPLETLLLPLTRLEPPIYGGVVGDCGIGRRSPIALRNY